MTESDRPRLSRRDVFKWFAATAAAMATSEAELFAAGPLAPAGTSSSVSATGYGTDPDLTRQYNPGDVWPLTLDASQTALLASLCDVILPADSFGPAASTLGIPGFIDEWISAPYPVQQGDRPLVLEGIVWMEAESQKRFQKSFAKLDDTGQGAICDDICNPASARPEFKQAARFFLKVRSLSMGAYFSTPAGWQAIGYVGNTPSATFDGPPLEVLQRLGVEQTVL